MSNSNKKNTTLNQHSALTTFKLNKGKYLKIGAEKAIFSLLLKSQTELKNTFREMILEKSKELLAEEEQTYFLNWIYSGKDFQPSSSNINFEKLIELSSEIMKYREQEIKDLTQDTSEREKLFSGLKQNSLLKLSENKKGNTLPTILNNGITSIFEEIKKYYKDLTIKKYLDVKTIDFTTLALDIGTNPTNLKADIKKATETVLEFNYINKKNLDIEVTSNLIASIRFTKDKLKHVTWLTYQIPREILELLLMPEIYVPLEGMIIHKLSGIYTIRMYGFLKDHLKRGEVEITKEELFNFFSLPASYQNKNNLVKKFLIPTLEEVKETTGIETSYRFYPEKRSYEKIYFYPSMEEKIIVPEVKIVTDEKRRMEIGDNEKVLKAIEKAKKNIYVQKAWDKRMDNKITKIYQVEGEIFTIEILNDLYTNLKKAVQTTLVQYTNGILKNKEQESKIVKKEKVPKVELNENQERKNLDSVPEKIASIEPSEEMSILGNLVYEMFLKMPDEEKEKIQQAARELFLEKTGAEVISKESEKYFKVSEKMLVIEVLKNNKM